MVRGRQTPLRGHFRLHTALWRSDQLSLVAASCGGHAEREDQPQSCSLSSRGCGGVAEPPVGPFDLAEKGLGVHPTARERPGHEQKEQGHMARGN